MVGVCSLIGETGRSVLLHCMIAYSMPPISSSRPLCPGMWQHGCGMLVFVVACHSHTHTHTHTHTLTNAHSHTHTFTHTPPHYTTRWCLSSLRATEETPSLPPSSARPHSQHWMCTPSGTRDVHMGTCCG